METGIAEKNNTTEYKKYRDILRGSIENKAKGFYGRNLACMFGNLNLNIPRDRLGQFRPLILPKEWQGAIL